MFHGIVSHQESVWFYIILQDLFDIVIKCLRQATKKEGRFVSDISAHPFALGSCWHVIPRWEPVLEKAHLPNCRQEAKSEDRPRIFFSPLLQSESEMPPQTHGLKTFPSGWVLAHWERLTRKVGQPHSVCLHWSVECHRNFPLYLTAMNAAEPSPRCTGAKRSLFSPSVSIRHFGHYNTKTNNALPV